MPHRVRTLVAGGILAVALVQGCASVAPLSTTQPSDAQPAASGGASPAPSSPAPTLAPPAALPPASVAEAHSDSHPLARDIAAMRRPLDVRISPDGERVAYLVRIPAFDPKAKPSDTDAMAGWKVENQIVMVGRTGGESRTLTRAPEPVLSFRWAPDGRSIAFLRSRDKSATLHRLPIDGGEAELINTGELEPETFEWSPDGKSIAFIATPPLTATQKEAAFRSGGVVDEDTRHRAAHLFVVPSGGGEPRRVTPGPEHIASFVWSPDGRRFAVTQSRSSDPYEVGTEVMPRIIAASDGALVQDLEARLRLISDLRWSPDGQKVAYLRGDDTLSLLNTIVVHDVASKKSWSAAAALDPTIGAYVWSGDSKRLTLLVHERTYSKLVQIPVGGGPAKDLGRTSRLIGGGIGDTDKSGRFLAVNSSTSVDPASPSVIELDKGAVRVVAQPNPDAARWTMGRTEVVRWQSGEGFEIEGLLVTTPHAEPGRPPPLVVMPHGGPDGVSQEGFSAWAQYFAARGYSVFQPNYRGSIGYGRAFYAQNRGRLGGIELQDIESGVDSLIQSRKVDPARLYYGGWSWGGYLTAFTIGNTKRYRAAMVGAGVIDVISQYVLSDINHGASAEWEFKGNPWKAPQRFDESNPLRLLHRVVTPTLVVHGDEDGRVPPMNAMVIYRALKDVGCEVRLLRYPREPHGFKEPAHVAHMLESWAAWFDSH